MAVSRGSAGWSGRHRTAADASGGMFDRAGEGLYETLRLRDVLRPAGQLAAGTIYRGRVRAAEGCGQAGRFFLSGTC